jgi:RNA polymerase sigma factor (sigma-70 family)
MSLALSVTQRAPSCTEHELIAAVRRGSDRAFEELYSRYRGRLGAYIFGLVGDHGRSEDIAQEVFISALRRLRNTERPIAFKPWIYEIAKNACIDEFRRTRRVREVPLEADDGDTAPERVLPARGQSPDLAVERKQSLTDLRGAFHGLSENHRKIIVMREFDGLSYGQISEQLGMTRPMVESTLFRARRRLGEEYDELVSGRRCHHVQALIDGDHLRNPKALGLRERRQVARHLAHCQPCRRYARRADVDESLFAAPGLARKLAALLPIPWLKWRGGSGRSHAIANRTLAVQQGAARYGDLLSSSGGLGRAVATIAAIGIAGIGGGVAGVVANPGAASTPSKTPAIPAATLIGSASSAQASPSAASDLRNEHQAASSSAAVVARKREAWSARHNVARRDRRASGGGSGGGAINSQPPSSPSRGNAPSGSAPAPAPAPQGGSVPALPKLPSPPAVSHPSVPSVVNRVLSAVPQIPQVGAAAGLAKQTVESTLQLAAPQIGKLRLG